MPDSYGKRQRRDVKAKKAASREERRVARAQRDADRAAGLIEPGTKIEAADPAALGLLDEPAAPAPQHAPARAHAPAPAPAEAPAQAPSEASDAADSSS